MALEGILAAFAILPLLLLRPVLLRRAPWQRQPLLLWPLVASRRPCPSSSRRQRVLLPLLMLERPLPSLQPLLDTALLRTMRVRKKRHKLNRSGYTLSYTPASCWAQGRPMP